MVDRRADEESSPGAPFRDAEAWLAERGIERDPIVVRPLSDAGDLSGAGDPSGAPGPTGGEVSVTAPPMSHRDAARLAGQAAADAALREADAAALPDPARRRLEDDVAEALAFVRRSTSMAPQSEGRVRAKLADRGWPAVVIDQAMARARTERLVDDVVMVAALVEERRARGHAVARVRRDLRDRGFDAAMVDAALADAEREDPEAAAFAVAREKAAGLTAVPAETAFRRVVGYVARRGYPDGLARKVAREAVFTARDPDRTTGH